MLTYGNNTVCFNVNGDSVVLLHPFEPQHESSPITKSETLQANLYLNIYIVLVLHVNSCIGSTTDILTLLRVHFPNVAIGAHTLDYCTILCCTVFFPHLNIKYMSHLKYCISRLSPGTDVPEVVIHYITYGVFYYIVLFAGQFFIRRTPSKQMHLIF